MEDLDFGQLTRSYLNHCKFEKGLDEKTISVDSLPGKAQGRIRGAAK